MDQKSLKAYRIDLRQYFEYIDSDNPKKNEIEAYITELHRKYKQKTVKRKLASIRAFYNYLEEEELVDGAAFGRIKVKFRYHFTKDYTAGGDRAAIELYACPVCGGRGGRK